jgi:hypothetical protein
LGRQNLWCKSKKNPHKLWHYGDFSFNGQNYPGFSNY